MGPAVSGRRRRGTAGPLLQAPFNAKPDEMKVMKQVATKIRTMGMFTFVKWNFIFIAPPLSITEEQIDEGLDIISQALEIADRHTSNDV